MSTSFAIGDRVLYAGAFGAFEPVECTIIEIAEKNGRLIYCNDQNRWGYTNQYSPIHEDTND